ncbi:MAG: elongation factor Ts [Gammaproteobacteria bacterium]|nr:MAG: elongation factor Ts [Gammaproteobacteria bacterium]RTZ59033.1 MAG: elongation factor Ts [Gammaproteobacteria bacterium]
MAITASMVKELRERTGVGMMDCKKALTEADGDLDLAAENLRKQGAAAADKKAGRIAAEGLIGLAVDDAGETAAIVEVNSETDFVAKADDFIAYTAAVAQTALSEQPVDLDALLRAPMNGSSVEDQRKLLIGKLGENMGVRRFERVGGNGHPLHIYKHGAKIVVVVEMEGGDETLGRDIAMHIAASKPVCVTPEDIPQEMLDKEKEIFTAQAKDSGKPDNIIEKIISGRIAKYINEICLTGQPFVKDPDIRVGKLLDQNNAKVLDFVRYEVGEGVEKKQEDFAAEVAAQLDEG